MQKLSLWNGKITRPHFNEESGARYFPVDIENMVPLRIRNADGSVHEDTDVEYYYLIFDNQTGMPVEGAPRFYDADGLEKALEKLNGAN